MTEIKCRTKNEFSYSNFHITYRSNTLRIYTIILLHKYFNLYFFFFLTVIRFVQPYSFYRNHICVNTVNIHYYYAYIVQATLHALINLIKKGIFFISRKEKNKSDKIFSKILTCVVTLLAWFYSENKNMDFIFGCIIIRIIWIMTRCMF